MEATAFDSKLDLASGFDAEESYNPLDFIEGEDDEDWMDDDGLLLPSALPPQNDRAQKTEGRVLPRNDRERKPSGAEPGDDQCGTQARPAFHHRLGEGRRTGERPVQKDRKAARGQPLSVRTGVVLPHARARRSAAP